MGDEKNQHLTTISLVGSKLFWMLCSPMEIEFKEIS